MIRRAVGVVAPGAWCFVGGAVEPGETQPEAVAREFREEVGGEVRPIGPLGEYLRPDGKLRLHYWAAELVDERLHANPAEVAELRWCTLAEILALPDLLPGNQDFAQGLARQRVAGGAARR